MLLLSFISFYCVIHPANGFSVKDIAHLIPENYSTIKPYDGEPVSFNWTITPYLVSDLSLKQMEFTVDIAIMALWMDDDLHHLKKHGLVNIPSNVAKQLWYPWIEFPNAKNSENLIDPNKNTFYLAGRSIAVFYRDMFVFTCVYDLSLYPFDTQRCSIDVILNRWNGPVNITVDKFDSSDTDSMFVPPEYWLIHSNQSLDTCKENFEPYDNASDYCFSYIFVFKRISTQHILTVFLPSSLIVILSWISFWLDVEMAAPRIALGLTSLLTLATQFNAAQKNVPAVATIKALDIWMFICILVVFSSLIVFAIAYTSKRMKTLRSTVSVTSRVSETTSKCVTFRHILNRLNLRNINVDKKARIIFPLFFIIFNITFWTIYI